MANRVDKKQALLARKEALLNDLQYYEKRIDEARNTKSNSSFYENDSSDSEEEFTIEISPSITELKLQQSMLKTCLHATQELTSVQVLQSEVNVMVDNPVFEGEPQITEEGTWRDVIVECRVDLVPFSMSFYVHKPERLFAPVSYRNLQVTAVKAAHERELAKSVLSSVTTPSEAVEVFRSYARAQRSRRGTLARLAETYADCLYMEPMAEGGYMLKCANLLEVSWTLQNKWSPIAPFHHRMKFDVEYMDESYIKIITQAHRQLSDPSLETDERTLLMAKIIKTCLEAEKPTQELHESFESESLKEKRQTLDAEPEIPTLKSKDSEIMAPPKYPPKKIKPKGKENNVNSKDKKRPSEENNEENVKRAKLDTNKSNLKVTSSKNKVNSNVNNITKKSSNLQVKKTNDIKNNDNTTNNKKDIISKIDPKTSIDTDLKNNNLKSTSNTSNTKTDIKAITEPKKSNVASAKHLKNDLEKNESDKTKKVATVKNTEAIKKKDSTSEIQSVDKNPKPTDKIKTKSKDTDELKKAKTTDNKKPDTDTRNSKKNNTDITKKNLKPNDNVKQKNVTKNINQKIEKPKASNLAERFSKDKINIENKLHSLKTNNINKNNKISTIKEQKKKSLNMISKVVKEKSSKIPQKRSSEIKKNPLRISPRKPQSNSNSIQDSSKTSIRSMQKGVTNIPRLLKKPTSKPKTML